jgi:hypothetical protein
MSLDALAAKMIARHEIAPIAPKPGIIRESREEDTMVNGSKRRVFVVPLVIPFTGNSDLLSCIPQSSQGVPPSLDIGETELTYSYLNKENLPAKQVDAHFRQVIANLEAWLTFPNMEARKFNEGMQYLVPKLLSERKKRLEEHSAFLEALSYPLQKVLPPAALAFPLQRNEIIVMEATSRAERQYFLENSHYHSILDTLALMSEAMERSPHAFEKIDEESLRFFFLVWLNANYRGGATGETFNFTGKTDILITVEGKTVFIGECKFWKGPESLKDAIDQVLSYACWRDTKTAILLFNRGTTFSTILSKIVGIAREHSSYVRDLETDGLTEKSFILQHPNDESQELTLTVLAFDLPLSEEKTGQIST